MKVELSGVLGQMELTAQSYDRIAELLQKKGNSHKYLEFSSGASTLRIMANELEKTYSVKKDDGESTE